MFGGSSLFTTAVVFVASCMGDLVCERYIRTERRIGAGGFGEVFLGFDRSNPGHEVAVKVVNLARLKDNVAAKIIREADILSTVNHANIVHLYGREVAALLSASQLQQRIGQLLIVLELCRGGDMGSLIANARRSFTPLPRVQMLRLFRQLRSGPTSSG
jgi:serine/threonine protein kinase